MRTIEHGLSWKVKMIVFLEGKLPDDISLDWLDGGEDSG